MHEGVTANLQTNKKGKKLCSSRTVPKRSVDLTIIHLLIFLILAIVWHVINKQH